LGLAAAPGAAASLSRDLQALIRPVATEAGLRWLYERARDADLLPPDLDLDHLAGLFATFAHHRRALACYRPRPYGGPLVLFRADEGPPPYDPLLGWGTLAGPHISAHEVPGDHYSMLRAPQVAVLAERIAGALARHDEERSRE
ncbi:MAG TPA: hypothetical protein VFI42_06125, partial [Thermomicrobiaceae bacterium]|nr:hypothetical protein [Thermomicrobiaceae bacterium]